jgi:hypothetical protein
MAKQSRHWLSLPHSFFTSRMFIRFKPHLLNENPEINTCCFLRI